MKTELKKLIALTGVGAVCAVVLRVLQIVFMLEADSGFFIKGLESMGNITTALIIFIIGVCTIYGACYKWDTPENTVITKPFGVLHFLLSAAIIYEALFSNFTADTQTWKILLQILFGLSAALVFALRGYQAFYPNKSMPILTVAYILFWLIRVIITFSSYLSASVISENIFEMLALSCALVFFFNYSALENGVGVQRRKKTILPSAIAALFSGAVHAVSQAVVILSGKAELLYNSNATLMTNIVLVFFVLNYVIILFKGNKETPEKKEE